MKEQLNISISPEVQQLIRSDLAWHYRILPKELTERAYHFYVDESADVRMVEEELEALLGMSIELEKVDATLIQRSLGRYYRNSSDSEDKLTFDSKVDFVDRLIQEANHLGSSDIHIEIYNDKARVRI
ncbi:MAG: hypothetical protein RLZ33_1134, partial [Bacteroidota bacterium]